LHRLAETMNSNSVLISPQCTHLVLLKNRENSGR
jgi:hypothetical protein